MLGATCFSGIGAPEMGLPECDWVWHAEIEPFPSAVMAARHPESVNLGDVLAADFIDRAKAMGPLDIMAGGPPCQAFSVAGLRGSMNDPRGNLTLRWVQILHAIQPRNAITENVPGWLNTPDNAFGCFLAGLVGADDALCSPLDGKWPGEGMVEGPGARAAWRILDAQYFGVAQRRRRVFVVADFGDGADPAEILFERQGLHGNFAPSRETGERTAPTLAARTKDGGGLGTDFDCDGGLVCADIAPTLNAHFGDKQGLEDQHISTGRDCSLPAVAMCLNAGAMGRQDAESETLIPTNRCDFDVSVFDPNQITSKANRSTPTPELCHTLPAASNAPVAFRSSGNCGAWETGDKIDKLTQSTDPNAHVIAHAIQAGALRENPNSGPDGMGVQSDIAYTIEARAEVQAVAFNITPSNSNKDYNARQSERAQTVTASGTSPSARGGDVVAFDTTQITSKANYSNPKPGDPCHPLAAGAHVPALADQWAVRRLTPTECARLQGFPDDYCRIEYRGKIAADGSIYKALGNSWAVPCGAWILSRTARAILAGGK